MYRLVVVVCIFAFYPASYAQVDCGGTGQIQGRVLDHQGSPVANASVSILSFQCTTIGIEPGTTSDMSGNFLLTRVPVGVNAVYASKEADGYPDSRLAIYSDRSSPAPKVTITEGETATGVVVKLGEKSGTLTGQVIDNDTSLPVVGARVTFSKADDKDRMLSTTVDPEGHFKVILPPRPIRFEVRAEGYKSWQFTSPDQISQGVLQLRPEEKRDVLVKLRLAHAK